MKLVNQIGNAYSLAGDNKKAADIFYRLLQYMRRHLQEMVTSNRMLPLVLYNFARSLDLLERYEESARVARNGKIIEKIGTYDPMTEPATVVLDKEKVAAWMKNGAQPTDTVKALINKAN